MNFFLPTQIITGKGCVKASADKIAALGKKCLIVTGKSSAKKCGALEDVISTLESKNIQYYIYDKIEQNPTIKSCIDGGMLARHFSADFIIGIGGGSPLDASKAIAVLAANEITENDLYSMNWKNEPLKVIAIGTTAGTGSEVTQVAVITASDGRKKSFRANSVFPVLCLGDASYTEFMPDSVTRSTAIDALSHCIESYFCKTSNDISRTVAKRGIEIIYNVFRGIVKGKKIDFEMRENLYLASLYGGISISVTGTAFPHALGYFLTEKYSVPHGTACAVYLPEFIRYNEKNAECIYRELFEDIDDEELIGLIKAIAPKADVKVNEDVFKEVYPRWINNSCLSKMYGDITADSLDKIVRKCVK